MTTSQVLVLVVATIAVVGGLTTIAVREITAEPWRDQAPRIRQLLLVLLPVAGTAILVVALWSTVG